MENTTETNKQKDVVLQQTPLTFEPLQIKGTRFKLNKQTCHAHKQIGDCDNCYFLVECNNNTNNISNNNSNNSNSTKEILRDFGIRSF